MGSVFAFFKCIIPLPQFSIFQHFFLNHLTLIKRDSLRLVSKENGFVPFDDSPSEFIDGSKNEGCICW